MKIIIQDRAEELHRRLRERLVRAERLRCGIHDQPVQALTIFARENGWFESQWTTCCEALEREATAIVKDRC